MILVMIRICHRPLLLAHDIEIMIISSSAFDRFISEYASKNKINNFLQKKNSNNLRVEIFLACLPIGLLRYISYKDNLNLKFEGITYKKFIDLNTLDINIKDFIRYILQYNKLSNIDHILLEEKLNTLIKIYNNNYQQACCGHDVINIIGLGLRKAIGSRTAQFTEKKNIESILRLAYNPIDIKSTELYKSIKKWESVNPQHHILAL